MNKKINDELLDKKPYRIAQIIRKLGDGGIESVVYNYYNTMDHDTFAFDVFYHSDTISKPSKELIDAGVRFYEIPPYQKDLLGYISSLRRIFRDNKYLIVHSNMNTISVFSLYAAWKEQIPIRIIHNHNVPGGNEVFRNAVKYLLRPFGGLFATDFFACSEKAGRWMFTTKYDKGLVKVIPNAIDFSRFRDVSSDEIINLKKQLGIEGKKVIGHVGRYTYAKNHRFLIDIIRSIRQKNPEFVLLLVGDGELNDEMNKWIIDKHLEDNVIQTGWVNKPEIYYNAMDVFVFPSLYEGFGMAVIEAQASGIPCIVSEAIPDEARISKEYFKLDLNAGIDEWVDAITSCCTKKNVLTIDSLNFDIYKCAPELGRYYLSRIKDVRRTWEKG